MFQGDPDAVRDVMAEMDRRRQAGEGSSRDVPSSSRQAHFPGDFDLNVSVESPSTYIQDPDEGDGSTPPDQ